VQGAINELDVEKVSYAALAASSGSSLVGFIQAGTGATARTAQSKLRDVVDVRDFGADPTGIVDSSAAIQAAIDYATANNFMPVATGTYRISQKIVIKCDANFYGAQFNVYNTPEYGVEISTGNATDPTTNLFNVTVWLPDVVNMTKPAVGWAGQKYGVRVVNINNCSIFVKSITNFATNLVITSFGGNGTAYNNFYLQFLKNGEINLYMKPGDATSWTNENNFFGGRFNQNSGEGNNLPGCCHIYMPEVAAGWVGAQNNNVFYKPSLEGDAPQYHVVNAGATNMIFNGRWETYVNPPKVLYTGNSPGQGSYNTIMYGYATEAIQFTYSGTAPIFNQWISTKNQSLSFDSTVGVGLQNQISSDTGIHAFYEAGTKPELAAANSWTMLHTAQNLRGKAYTDAYARIQLDYSNGKIKFGNGTAAPVVGFSGNGTAIYTDAAYFIPLSDATTYAGLDTNRFARVYSSGFYPGAGTVIWTSGSGTPEGVVTAPVGSLYTRTNGGAGTTLYVKETGTGNTGWVGK
jgi:hypothetical protein